MFAIKLRADNRELKRRLTRFAFEQLPFATALALNATARQVVQAEGELIEETFDQPRDFTKKAWTQSSAFGGQIATKRDQTAVVVSKPIQEKYLSSSAFNEPQSLGDRSKKIRTPVNVRLGAGGNIPKGEIARLLAQPDVFMGAIDGVNGIWQRPTPKRPKGAPRARIKANNTGRLKLLIAFTRPVQVRTRLGFRERAEAIVRSNYDSNLQAAITRAMGSAIR
jgi:hypothetical protein